MLAFKYALIKASKEVTKASRLTTPIHGRKDSQQENQWGEPGPTLPRLQGLLAPDRLNFLNLLLHLFRGRGHKL